MTTFSDDCAELGELWPQLRGALSKDTGDIATLGGTAESVPFNADVMHAITELEDRVPPATTWAAGCGSETWPHRPVAVCLVNLPRFHARLMDLNLSRDAAAIETDLYYWRRTVKLALRLIDPPWDLPAWVVCTAHDIPRVRLRHIGAERAIQWANGEPRPVLVRDGYWLCPHCGATWPNEQWELLIAALTAPVRQAS
jgi:hypothetical protein